MQSYVEPLLPPVLNSIPQLCFAAIGTAANTTTPSLRDAGNIVAGINAKLGAVNTNIHLVGAFAELPAEVQNYAMANGVTPDVLKGITFGKEVFATKDRSVP